MKTTVKRSIKGAAMLAGGLLHRSGPRSLILTYHGVGRRRHAMTVSPEAFRGQMDWLAEHATVIELDRAARGEPGVAITFDDGFVDNLTNAAPVLQNHGFPATVFMVTERAGTFLDNEPDPDHGRLMTWSELARIREFGVTVGAHTANHVRLRGLSPDQQSREISVSKAQIEEHLGQPVTAFAYPYGSALDYDATSISCVREASFQLAASNRYGINCPGSDCYQLRRIWVDATDDLTTFAAKVTGRLDLLRHLDSPVGIRLRRVLNRLDSR